MPSRLRNHYVDNVLVEQVPYTLFEDIVADCEVDLKQLGLDMVGGLPWPTTIDDWRTRYDPIQAVVTRAARKGFTFPTTTAGTLLKNVAAQTLDAQFRASILAIGHIPGKDVEG